MPLLIDGNNLMHTLKKFDIEVERDGLCKLLSAMVGKMRGTDRAVCVVFDGPSPHGPRMRQISAPGILVRYSQRRRADDLIIEEIEDNTAPRRLRVVSSDRQIRSAARRRRCPSLTSPEFIQEMLSLLDRPAPPPPEPREKRAGSSAEQTQQWLREFGIEED